MASRRRTKERRRYTAETEDSIPLTQDDGADKVVWEEEPSAFPTADPHAALATQAMDPDSSDNSNVSFSFAWKDLNSIKKKRKSAAIEKEDDFINALTCSMAAEDEVSVAVEDRGSSSCPSSQPDQPLSVPSSSYDYEFDVELTEEDLMRIDADIERMRQATQHELMNRDTEPLPESLRIGSSSDQSVLLAPIQPAAGYDDDDEICLSAQDIAMLEEIERQALQAQPFSSNTVTEVASMQQQRASEVVLCVRLKVLQVEQRNASMVLLRCNSEQQQEQVFVELVEDWLHVEVTAENIIHVIMLDEAFQPFKPTHSNHMLINNAQGLLIVHPDNMLSPTRIADACGCMRKSVLSDRLRSFGNLAAAAVMGNLRHSFIEGLTEMVLKALHGSTWQSAPNAQAIMQCLGRGQIEALMAQCISEHVLDLYCIHITDQEIYKDLGSILMPTIQWVLSLTQLSVHAAYSQQPNCFPDCLKHAENCQMVEVHTIEEAISSQILGVKGQLDMIAGAKLVAGPKLSPGEMPLMLPIEIKTGKWRPSTVMAHRAQVILYVLLMKLREHTSVLYRDHFRAASYGIILYMSEQEQRLDLIQPAWPEVRALILSRNQLAVSIKAGQTIAGQDKVVLPAILNDKFNCEGCFQAAECVTYHAAYEDPAVSQFGNIKDMYQFVMKGISAKHLQYFKYWEYIATMEATAITEGGNRNGKSNGSSMYSVFAQYRESLGSKCISNLQLSSHQAFIKLPSTPYLVIVLRKPIQHGSGTHVVVGDRMVLSMEHMDCAGRSAVALLNVLPSVAVGNVISVGTERCDGLPESLLISFQIVQGATNFARFLQLLEKAQRNGNGCNVIFRLDKDDSSVSIQSMRSNLMELMVEPYSPKAFQEASRPYKSQGNQNPEQMKRAKTSHPTPSQSAPAPVLMNTAGMGGVTAGADRRKRLRELIIDMHPPRYAPLRPKGIAQPAQTTQTSNKAGQQVNGPVAQTARPMLPPTHPPQSAQSKLPFPQAQLHKQSAAPAAPPPANPRLPQLLQMALQDPFLMSMLSPDTIQQQVFCEVLQILQFFNDRLECSYGNTASNANNKLLPANSQSLQRSQSHPGPAKGSSSSGSGASNIIYYKNSICITRGECQELYLYYCTNTSQINPNTLIHTIYPGCHPLYLLEEYCSLNTRQQEAIDKVLVSQDYMLIQGFPGTGKTSLLCLLIRLLVSKGKLICFTSYTHNAIDHLMEKLVAKGFTAPFVTKLVSNDHHNNTAHRDAHAPVEDQLKKIILEPAQYSSVTALQKRIGLTRLFASTVLTANKSNVLGAHRRLDYCIIDEASQLLEVLCISVILKSNVFVLVGDTHQLLPLLLSKSMQSNTAIVRPTDAMSLCDIRNIQPTTLSLFSKLHMVFHTINCVTLSVQYRMHADIMLLSNTLVYQQGMECGNQSVAEYRIQLPRLDQLPARSALTEQLLPPHSSLLKHISAISRHSDWLYIALHPMNPVVFLNTDTLYSGAIVQGSSSVVNATDAEIVRMLLWGLEQSGFHAQGHKQSEVTILTPFRAQLQLLQSMLKVSYSPNGCAGGASQLQYEIGTVDSFQGKDCDVVIFNTVKSPFNFTNGNSAAGEGGEEDMVGMLLKDWRRINVALTRARGKMIVLGSMQMMQQQNPSILHGLSSLLSDRGWLLNLPTNTLQGAR